MSNQDEILQIVDDPDLTPEVGPRWKVAVIDDDPAVHDGTKFALADYQLNGQQLDILSAFSAAEGREMLARNPDIAAVLLDVIMETDSAGLDLVHYIRNALKNETVRVILRTAASSSTTISMTTRRRPNSPPTSSSHRSLRRCAAISSSSA